MKPQLAAAIENQTGIRAEFNGDVNFSLLGRATIVARDISVPFGTIHSVMFSVPMFSVFHPTTAELTGPVSIYGGNFKINDLNAFDFNTKITLYNSRINFMSHDYDIVRGELKNGRFNGTVRTPQHKYDVTFEKDEFIIHNYNDKLEIIGQLYNDGSANGQFSIETDDINRWFEFSEPKIPGTVNLTMDFAWDGGHGFDFRNIVANNVNGNIKLYPDGHRDIQLRSSDIDYDFSFLSDPVKFFFDTNLDIEFYGDLKFGNRKFNHIKIATIGTGDKIQIRTIVTDNVAINGGYIDADGAHDLMAVMPLDGRSTICLFSGTPTNWGCREFTQGNLSGSLSVNGDEFDITVESAIKMPSMDTVLSRVSYFGTHGTVNFKFSDASGTLYIDGNKIRPEFRFAKNKTLDWLNAKLPFLPKQMADAVGDVEWESGAVVFKPHDGTWQMAIQDDFFYIYGKDFKVWMPDIDLDLLRNGVYTISGEYKNGVISDLTINVANHVFTGSVVDGDITLKTNVLDIDSFLSPEYVNKYEELSFFKNHPLMIPFGLGFNLSLSADTLVYNGEQYANFVYSLKSGSETFSITDDAHGNILATIKQDGINYDVLVQLNKFQTVGKLLSDLLPLNIADSFVTGNISMATYGHIAHDIEYNLNGDVDLIFNGGYIYGIGTDEFFSLADQISILNAEYALADALSGGKTRLKSLHIIGHYDRGNFETTDALALSLPHVDATGALKIIDGKMSANFYLVLRGTAPEPAPIDLTIGESGERTYSLSEIMQNFDPAYMRQFVKNHSRF